MYVKLKLQFFLMHESMLLTMDSEAGWVPYTQGRRAGVGLLLSSALRLFLAGQVLL